MAHKDVHHADLVVVRKGDVKNELINSLQHWAITAPVMFVISAIYERTTVKYGKRGERYVHIEVGHAAENLLLQAFALGLEGCVAGAFDDAAIKRVVNMPREEMPLYVIAVGRN